MNLPLHVISLVVTGLLALVAGCGELPQAGIDQIGARAVAAPSDDSIRQMFEAADRACPRKVDPYTTLNEVKIVDDTNIEFHYVVDGAGAEFASRIEKKTLRAAMIDQMRGKAVARAVAERDLSIRHLYDDASGRRLLAYTIDRSAFDGASNPSGGRPGHSLGTTNVKADASQNVVDPAAQSEPALPQQWRPTKKSKENPAGVQQNPYLGKS